MRSHKHYWSDIVNPTGVVPGGGSDNQLLAKASNDDYDTEWIDQADLEGVLPPGGEEGQIPVKGSGSDYDYTWEDPNILQDYIVDGDFDFWYEGISQTTSGYGSDTMWKNNMSGTTKVHSQGIFDVGQIEVPGNIDYFSRTTVTSVAGSSNFCDKSHNIEDVKKLSGKNITFSFWAKADSAKNISIEFVQDFGTGGSPSSDLDEIGVEKIAITTSWSKYTVNVDIPSISGKALGTDGNDHTKVVIWFDAGSDYNSRTDSLGQQSGVFDVARVRLVEGTVDGDSLNEDIVEVQQKINRYYQSFEEVEGVLSFYNALYATIGPISFTTMRSVPSYLLVTSPTPIGGGTLGSLAAIGLEVNNISFAFNANATAGFAARFVNMAFTLDARL